MLQTEMRGVRAGLLACLADGWKPAVAHLVTFRVLMPDPAMEAVVEVNGDIHEMLDGRWGSKVATVWVEEATAEFRFGTPAGPLEQPGRVPPATALKTAFVPSRSTAIQPWVQSVLTHAPDVQGVQTHVSEPLADPASPADLQKVEQDVLTQVR